MTGTPHRDRLLWDLNTIRKELEEEAGRITPEELDWAPAEGMKTLRELLAEIGTMEALTVSWLADRKQADWQETWNGILCPGEGREAVMARLAQIRQRTLAYLEAATEELLETPEPLPPSWVQYFPSPELEPEELVRWIGKHEYYHLGQIITCRWIRGDNPYKRG